MNMEGAFIRGAYILGGGGYNRGAYILWGL